MNLVVQTTGGNALSINGKSESLTKNMANIKIALLMNYHHRK